jgi:hypothetical protein
MKFGVREICEVVLKAKATQKVGNKTFYKNEPVIYFDTLKTSSMEGAATTVYAQGGRGNSRLVAWEGERTVTFTMEDALISPAGFMILSGAGLVEASKGASIKVHQTEQTDKFDAAKGIVYVSEKPYADVHGKENYAYVMLVEDGEVVSEPFIPKYASQDPETEGEFEGLYGLTLYTEDDLAKAPEAWKATLANVDVVLVDYYTAKESGVQQIEITPDKFGGNYYLEASTLFRNTDGVDLPAEFIIPNCKIQSNFTFTMASSGDPSTFTFTMDAFPDYTRFDKTKKVLAAIQIIGTTSTEAELVRERTQTKGGEPADTNPRSRQTGELALG